MSTSVEHKASDQNKRSWYSERLRDPRWQKRRLQIMERDGWTCQECGDTETTFNIHHKWYSGEPWEAPDDALVTLCEPCHKAKKDEPKNDFLLCLNEGIPGFMELRWASDVAKLLPMLPDVWQWMEHWHESKWVHFCVWGEGLCPIYDAWKTYNGDVPPPSEIAQLRDRWTEAAVLRAVRELGYLGTLSLENLAQRLEAGEPRAGPEPMEKILPRVLAAIPKNEVE